MNNKKIIIVFSDNHLPYSPSTLNLFNALKNRNLNVWLLAPEPDANFSLLIIKDERIRYFKAKINHITKVRNLYRKVIDHTFPEIVGKHYRLYSEKAVALIDEIKRMKADVFVAVDFFSLWCINQAGMEAHLLSLEINEADPFRDNCDLSSILTVLIQSRERYNYIFNGKKQPPFYLLPNSPEYLEIETDYKVRNEKQLIYCGSAMSEFGIFSCLDFISDFPEYTLTIKGAVPPSTREGIEKFYRELLDQKRLIIDEQYLDSVSLTYYVSRFRIGFVFYDFFRFQNLRRFNYFTAPSGKLFQYFNSGVPVIGNQLDGFEIVNKSNSGKLIPYLSSVQIKSAIDYIENNYQEMCHNSKMNSLEFDTAKYTNKWIQDQIKD